MTTFGASFRSHFLVFFLLPAMAGQLPGDEPATAPVTPIPAAPLAPFPPETRWAAIGDSITHAGWYIHFIHFYYMTRFPTQKLTLFDGGCNGDAAWQCIKRYPYDIAPLHPTVVSIMFGMNDGGLAFYNPDPSVKWSEPLDVLKPRAVDSYEKNLRALVERIKADNIPVILITPTPYDDVVKSTMTPFVGYNAALTEMTKRAEKVGQEEGIPVVDFNTPMNKINQDRQAADPTFSDVGGFRIHPGPQGHLVMAYAFLTAQHAPSDVARFSVKGTDGTVTSAGNCQIDQAKVENGGVSFRYSANALPFPIEHWYRQPLDWIPFTRDLNQEVFQVTDLPAGSYDLQIDGKSIRTCTADELAAGVNLSEDDKTPEYQQAAAAWHVYSLVFDDYVKLRDLVTMERNVADEKTVPRPLTMDQLNPLLDAYVTAHTGKPDEVRSKKLAADLRALKPKEADLHAQIDAAVAQAEAMVQPKPHLVSIIPATVAAH